jgi:sec-independent protein translocase protein TatA
MIAAAAAPATRLQGACFMGSFSIWHWLIVLVVVLVLFGGGGKLSRLMGDLAKGVTAFRKGLKEGEGGAADEPKSISADAGKPAHADAVRRDEAAKG